MWADPVPEYSAVDPGAMVTLSYFLPRSNADVTCLVGSFSSLATVEVAQKVTVHSRRRLGPRSGGNISR